MTGATKKSGFRITYLLTGVTMLAMVVAYFYGSWASATREEDQKPRLALASLVKALRQYEKGSGKFPDNFDQLEEKVWKHKNRPDFGDDRRRFSIANYYYVYHPVDGQTATVWALPTGPKSEDGATLFVVVYPDRVRTWKGPALGQEEVTKLKPVPDEKTLALLGLTEQKGGSDDQPRRAGLSGGSSKSSRTMF